jgi:hypothetical protein
MIDYVKKIIYFSLLTGCLTCWGQAGVIPSCYDTRLPVFNTEVKQDLFVLVDQTTILDDTLKQQIADQVRPFLVSGNSFSFLTFSSYSQGKYTQVLVSGRLEQKMPLEVRNDISKPLLNKHDQCMSRQPQIAAQAAGAALKFAFEGTSNDLAKSDIYASLKDISSKLLLSSANSKIVLLVSDMLENSSITSFYQNQSVRRIDPEKELQLAANSKMFGDFGGARIYVIGAGLLSEDARSKKGIYREPQTMSALQNFWRLYFEKSNAQLVEFGQPSLLNPIH